MWLRACFPTDNGFFLAQREVKKAPLTGKNTGEKTETNERLRTKMRQLYSYVASGYYDCYRNKLLPILLPFK